MRAKPKTIDDYLSPPPADRRATLEALRRTIKAIVPRAEDYRKHLARLGQQVLKRGGF